MPKRCLRNALKALKSPTAKTAQRFQNARRGKVSSVQSLWRTACETAEQQQDSCPNHAKQQPEKMPKRHLRNALKAKVSNSKNSTTLPVRQKNRWKSLQEVPLPKRLRNIQTPAGFVPNRCKRCFCWTSLEEMLCENLENARRGKVSSVQSLWRTACETAEQQQDSCPNHAKQQPEKMPKRCLRNALKAKVSNSKNSTTLPERSTRQGL